MKLFARLGELPSSQMPCFAINRREGRLRMRSQGPEVLREEEKREKKKKEEKKKLKHR